MTDYYRMPDSFGGFVSDVSQAFHDMAIPQRALGASQMALGISTLALAIPGAAEAETAWEAFMIAADIEEGVRNAVFGSVRSLAGPTLGKSIIEANEAAAIANPRELVKKAAKYDPSNVGPIAVAESEAISLAKDIRDILKGKPVEQLRGLTSAIDKLSSLKDRSDRSGGAEKSFFHGSSAKEDSSTRGSGQSQGATPDKQSGTQKPENKGSHDSFGPPHISGGPQP